MTEKKPIDGRLGILDENFVAMAKVHEWPQVIRMWTLIAMMRQRNITLSDIAKQIGISKQRAHQMVGMQSWRSEKVYNRIEDAITAITEQSGGIYGSVGMDDQDGKRQQLKEHIREFVGDSYKEEQLKGRDDV